jgi:hypothetical protein
MAQAENESMRKPLTEHQEETKVAVGMARCPFCCVQSFS